MKKLLFLMFLLFMPLASASHMTLLAVAEHGDEMIGSTADLFLDIKQGSGHVFMDTFPLTKLDTQLSTRFAKHIACDIIDYDCDDYDFFYTIRSESSLVGGPSAGAAIAVLTALALMDEEVDENITVTGTINPGGLVGPIGGLKEKIKAAADVNLSLVLIPSGTRFFEEKKKNDTNETENNTIDLYEYGKNLSVEVKEVETIYDIIFEYTGKELNNVSGEIVVDDSYKETMELLAVMLCNRTKELRKAVRKIPESFAEKLHNLSVKSENAFENESYYASASFCYGENVQLSYLYYNQSNMSKTKKNNLMKGLQKNLENMNDVVANRTLNTMTDLQAYLIVKQRLIEADKHLKSAHDRLKENYTDVEWDFAYANERLYSAESWSKFFGKGSKTYVINNESLRNTCIEKISEAEERFQYLGLIYPRGAHEARTDLDDAYAFKNSGEFALCLFKAIKAKAEADVVLGVIGIKEERLNEYLELKLRIVKKLIIEQTAKNVFPILGYSYYEYANVLKGHDLYSALLYAEYGLEMSNLDLYFETVEDKKIEWKFNYVYAGIFVAGFLFGVLFAVSLRRKKAGIKKKRK